VDVVVGDFDEDGKTDLAARNSDTGQWFVSRTVNGNRTTAVWGSWSTAVNWKYVQAADVDGDGDDDLIGWAPTNGAWLVQNSSGSSFTNQAWGTWDTSVAWENVEAADVTGDGQADIVGRHPTTGVWWVQVSNANANGFQNQSWGSWSAAQTWLNVQTADVNRDGRADIIGRLDSSDAWLVQRSTGSGFVNELWGYWTTSDTFANVLVGAFAEPDNTDYQAAPVYEYQYDKVSNLRFEIDPLGRVTEYRYDNRDRLVKVIHPDPDGPQGPLAAPATAYVYNAAGELKEVKELENADDLTGPTTFYDYDELGRLEKLTLPDPDPTDGQAAPFHTYTYDAAGRLTSETDPLQHVTEYDYDGHDNLTLITYPDPDGNPGGGPASPVTTRTFDDVGRLLSEKNAFGYGASYGYNALDHLTSETDANNQTTTFTYDALGNRLTLTDPKNNTTRWVYDNLYRVKEERQEQNPTNPSRFFQYDAAGNLTKKTDRNGRVTEYEYDQLHRLRSEHWKNTDAGAVIRSLYFTYDAADRMISAADPAAAYILW
jgi:YD repeat-containing protein